MHVEEKLYNAFVSGDIPIIHSIFSDHPKLKRKKMMGGGNWLYSVAGNSTADVIKYLIEIGIDAHAKADQEGDNALCSAARSGRNDIVEMLLEHDVEMDTSLSVRNPLFGAIGAASGPFGGGFDKRGNPEKVIELLFRNGIDASIEYKSPTMNRQIAAGHALCDRVPEIAELIVSLQAEYGANNRNYYMHKAIEAADRQKTASPYKDWVEVI